MYVLNAGTWTVKLTNDVCYKLSVYEIMKMMKMRCSLVPRWGFPPRTERTSFPWGGGQPGLCAHQRSSGRRGSGCRLAAGGGNVPDHN